MYENEIEELKDAAAHHKLSNHTADTAIALMRAAPPEDEAAEREHCERAVTVWNDPNDMRGAWWILLLRERAAVRAVSAAKLDEISAAYAYVRDMCAKTQRRAESMEVRALNAERELAALKAAGAPARCSECKHYKGAAHPGWCHAREDGE